MKELKANCPFCSLACPLILRGGEREPIFTAESIMTVDWDKSEDSKFGGSICARGNAVAEFLTHPRRVNYPFILGERSTISAVVAETAKNLEDIMKESGGEAIGVLLGENLTNEEAALAVNFAHGVLHTSNIALFAPDDTPLFRAYLARDFSKVKPAGPKPAGDRVVALIIGDSFTEHPCTAKNVLSGKYGSRGSEVIVVSPEVSHTAWFANRHLRCRPGGETAVVAGLLKAAAEKAKAPLTPELDALISGMDWSELERLGGVSRGAITGAAGSMLGAAKVTTYISNIFARISACGLAFSFAEALTSLCPGERAFVPQFVQQNTWGIYSVLAAAGKSDCLEKLAKSELKALVALGLDLFSVYPAAPVERAMRERRFTVTTQFFWNQTADRANVVIPAASLMEKKGTVSPAFGEDLVRDEVMPPLAGAVTAGNFLLMLAKEMGAELAPVAKPARRTDRSASADGVADEWSGYCASMKELDSANAVLIPWSEAVHAADGSITRNFYWSEITCPDAMLMISEEIAARYRLKDGDRADVSTAGAEIVLPVRVTKKLEGAVAAATIHFPAVRKLFPLKLDAAGGIVLGPVPVRLSRQSGK
ncbi:MAG: molybdopterin dinucleotide binding domain-containing protein [Candidatus Krumholzibacteria bacterium]|nr:molybdopterin dinucleotide binding domain-containing protein [Candidatus Krumholzibacteria bacterium]